MLYFWHRVANGTLTLLSNVLTNVNLTDMETCYKMVRSDVMKSLPLRSRRFGIEPEITAPLARAGARIYEVPISYSGRTYAEGKKINWRDGVAAVWHILAANLLYRASKAATAARKPAAFPAEVRTSGAAPSGSEVSRASLPLLEATPDQLAGSQEPPRSDGETVA